MTAAQVLSALQTHHKGDAWAFFAEVRNTTGFSRQIRSADALAISLWPSRGLYAQGYEIKVSKSDLDAELKEPNKADEIGKFCLHWFLATPEGLTEGRVIPAGWGIVEVRENGKLKWKRPAPANEYVQQPTWGLIASISRQLCAGMVPASTLQQQVEEEVKRRVGKVDEQIRSRFEADLKSKDTKIENLKRCISNFEKSSGVNLDRYQSAFLNEEIGEAVRVVRKYRHLGLDGGVRVAAERLREIAADIDELAKHMPRKEEAGVLRDIVGAEAPEGKAK